MFGNYTISGSCDNQNHVCEVEYNIDPDDYFIDELHSSILNGFLYMISCVALICFSGTVFHYLDNLFTNENIVFYRNFSIISLLIMVLIYVIDVSTMGNETCLFPRWCHEGIDDQILPSFYFYQMHECPRYNSWLTDYYSDANSNHNYDCESSEYGCCEVGDIECDVAYREGDTYSRYELINNDHEGHWALHINKQDEEGSNCPTVEELIYQVSKNDLSNQMLNAIISYTITAMILMCLGMICRNCMKKEEYKKTDSDDVENSTLWEESSEDNDNNDDNDDNDNNDNDNDNVTEKSWSLQASV